MTAQILYLFPDTNLFIQCRPLHELDWPVWASFDEVHLIVTRPVQREIDNQKNRGNDRVGTRARRAHSVFREIITEEQGYKLVREAGPQVKLLIEPSWRPSPKLSDRLDFGDRDDALIGCLHAYREKHPEVDARLLSHDAGPVATAKMLCLPFVAIPDQWLVPPESSQLERENIRLETELARLKKAEPMFRIICIDDGRAECDDLEFEYILYEPLTDDEVTEFMDELRTNFPLAIDFGSSEPAKREHSSLLGKSGMNEVYTPASGEEISKPTLPG